MDSLRILRDSLDSSRPPPAGPTKRYDKKLNSDFKAAALHLTNLYRNSIASSQSTYRSGYVQGLRDILELVMLRASQSQSPTTSTRQQQQQGSQPDFERAGGTVESGLTSNVEDDNDDDEASRGPSHKELRWLARYLRARIEAIKSESDEEDAEAQDGDQQLQQASSSSSRGDGLSYRSPSTSAPVASRTRENSARSQRLSNEPDERAMTGSTSGSQYSSSVSIAPDTPVTRFQRPFAGSRAGRQNLSVTTSSPMPGQGQSRDVAAAPPSSSGFSFSMPPRSSSTTASPLDLSPPVISQPSASGTPRRRVRGIPSHASSSSSSPIYGVRQVSSGNQNHTYSHTGTLSPVNEESRRGSPSGMTAMTRLAMEDDMEDVREERPNGRRGPLIGGGGGAGAGGLTLDGQGRPKRRRKTTAEKVAAAAVGMVGGGGLATSAGTTIVGGTGVDRVGAQGQMQSLGMAMGQSQASSQEEEESETDEEASMLRN